VYCSPIPRNFVRWCVIFSNPLHATRMRTGSARGLCPSSPYKQVDQYTKATSSRYQSPPSESNQKTKCRPRSCARNKTQRSVCGRTTSDAATCICNGGKAPQPLGVSARFPSLIVRQSRSLSDEFPVIPSTRILHIGAEATPLAHIRKRKLRGLALVSTPLYGRAPFVLSREEESACIREARHRVSHTAGQTVHDLLQARKLPEAVWNPSFRCATYPLSRSRRQAFTRKSFATGLSSARPVAFALDASSRC
jgi:hypothetical protein